MYIGKIGTGLIWLFTLGLLGIGQLIDLFTLSGQVDTVNLKKASLRPQQINQVLSISVDRERTTSVAAAKQVRAPLDFVDVRARLVKLDKLYVGDLLDESEYHVRKRTVMRELAEAIQDDDPEDGIIAADKLRDEGLLTEAEFKRIKTAIL